MARLIKWHANIVDPGFTSTNAPTESEQTQTHLAEFDKPPSIEEVYNLRECPQLFDFLVGINGRRNSNLFLVGREVQQLPEAPQIARVRCTYSNKWQNEQNADTPNVEFSFIVDPTKRPAMVEWGTYVIREALEMAKPYKDSVTPAVDKEVPVWTTAGEPILFEEEYHRRMLTITKNVKQVDEVFAEGSDYINEEDTRIGGHLFKKLTLWLADVSIGHISFENGVIYYPLQMRILHNPKTWIRRLRNQGLYMRDFNYVIGDNGEKIYPTIPIILSDGTRTQQPILLNRQGRPIQAKVTSTKRRADGTGNEYAYEIMAPDEFARNFTQEELEESVRYYLTRNLLNFTRRLPLF